MYLVIIFYTIKYYFIGDYMRYLKNIIFSLGITIAVLFIFTFILTILSYFNITSDSITTVFKMIIPIISILTSSIYLGINSTKKGWLEGLKLGIIICILLFLFNILGLNKNIKINQLLFYGILIFSSIVGSMIGISRKKSQ